MAADYDIRQKANLADSGGLLTFIWNNRYKFLLWIIMMVGMIVLWIVATPLMAGIFQMVFQLLYVMLFMIVQFGALFLFLGRGRVYWV